MRNSRLPRVVGMMIMFCAVMTITSSAQLLNTLLSFNGSNGQHPDSSLIQATDGNFYGVTQNGGVSNQNCTSVGCGTVFKITPSGTLTTLYQFCSLPSCADGANPYGYLVQGTDGNFYGTTIYGGANLNGTVFKITSTGTLTTLHSFALFTDGAYPWAGLVQATDGNFYGTTTAGGLHIMGTVFKITPAGALSDLYNFCTQSACTDGATPYAPLVQGTDGNLYGTTTQGGDSNYVGTVFKITTAGALTTIHTFCTLQNCADGEQPFAALLQASDGNFYGTTTSGHGQNAGTVFKITSGGTLTTLYTFCALSHCADGQNPYGGVVQGSDGNFYGTTNIGGTGQGTLFKLTPSGTLTTLYTFGGPDGELPYSGLVQGNDGNFYGTTHAGGSHNDGTVFSLTPATLIPTTTVLMSAPNPSTLGQAVTMTATVTAQDHSLPTGTVKFQSNGVDIGSASLNGSGVAVLIYAGLSAGTDSLTAIYQGSGTLAGSTSNTVPQVVQPGSTTTTVTSSPNPSTFGEAVTITATVSPAGPPAPTGTVSFTSNGTAISGCTAVPLGSSLTAVCMTSTLAVGTDAIVATYSGDTNYSGSSGGLSQLVNPIPSPLQFVAVTPCRLVDTRPQHGGSGPIQGGTSQSFPIPQEGGCNIPTNAAAYSLNVTVVPSGPLGYLTIWPTGEGQPVVSTMNSVDGRVKADAAIVPAGSSGEVSVYVTNTTDVILDIDGYFAPVSGSTLAFYPLTPCRVADTRVATFPPGLGPPQLSAATPRDFPVLLSPCIPTGINPAAYSFNFTVVPGGHPVGYLSAWPTGQSQPVVSTLNDQTGTIVANAAIVPAGTGGDISVYSTNDTQLLIDINGYFAPAGPGGLSLYAVAPCRVIDTRHVGSGQPFSGTLNPPVDVVGSFCGPPATALAYVFNATVVPTGALGYLTLWPDGTTQPVVSTLNAFDGALTNNMAIVPTNNGKVDAYANGLTQLILDISSYFAP